MRFITSVQTAEKWGITKRRVNSLCKEGAIPGAYKEGYRWMIPENAVKPGSNSNDKTGNREVPNSFQALPIGISDFRTAVSQYYYVDKTLLIKDILDYRPLVSLFTRPRRFGKTLNMDMLRVFFEQTDEDSSIYFKHTKIWNEKKYRNEQGKYPVIFLTFKDVKYDDWKDTFINLKAVIQNEYKRHLYLVNSEKISDLDKKLFYRILEGSLEDALWPNTLANLTFFLHEHHEKAPIIIIDEYDTPIQQGYMKGYYDSIILFMRNFLSGGLKDNHHITMAFLTGILRVARESIFSGLNNLYVNSILEERYCQYFGFTKDEVHKMLEDFGKSENYNEVMKWYNGYQFGTIEIFNPWSVLNYIDAGCFPKAFWQSTGNNDIIGEIMATATPEIMENLKLLMNGQTIQVYIDISVIYPEIIEKPYSIYSFLLMAGYLTVRTDQKLYDGNSYCEICIPNREISIVYEKEILSKLQRIVPASTAIAIQQALFTENVEKLQREMECFLLDTVSCHDAASESFYHGLVLGMSAMFNNYYTITSNREEGYGRYDIQLKPHRTTLPGFILELKALTQEHINHDAIDLKLEHLVQEALSQIDKKNYCNGLKTHVCSKIIKIGIAFYKKQCKVGIVVEQNF